MCIRDRLHSRERDLLSQRCKFLALLGQCLQLLADVYKRQPSDFIELSTEHSRKQLETLTEQTKELAALAQKVTLATVEPLKTGVTKAFSQAA